MTASEPRLDPEEAPGPDAQDSRVGWMREFVGNWLARESWQPEDLHAWLEGLGLPAVGHDDEPYLWILRGLPLAERRGRAERMLAERVAAVLERQPDVHRPGRRPEQVLYNLLMLAAGLGDARELAEPLHAMAQRSALAGEWLGLGLQHALREAVAENQIDQRFLPEWQAMLEGREGALFPGRPRDGFAGVLKMPDSPTALGQPAVGALGWALARMAVNLEAEQDRGEDFRELIAQIYRRYFLVDPYDRAGAGARPFDRELRVQAAERQWPTWAIECLPVLRVATDGNSAGGAGAGAPSKFSAPPEPSSAASAFLVVDPPDGLALAVLDRLQGRCGPVPAEGSCWAEIIAGAVNTGGDADRARMAAAVQILLQRLMSEIDVSHRVAEWPAGLLRIAQRVRWAESQRQVIRRYVAGLHVHPSDWPIGRGAAHGLGSLTLELHRAARSCGLPLGQVDGALNESIRALCQTEHEEAAVELGAVIAIRGSYGTESIPSLRYLQGLDGARLRRISAAIRGEVASWGAGEGALDRAISAIVASLDETAVFAGFPRTTRPAFLRRAVR